MDETPITKEELQEAVLKALDKISDEIYGDIFVLMIIFGLVAFISPWLAMVVTGVLGLLMLHGSNKAKKECEEKEQSEQSG